jgi:hypothetical protein
VLKIRSDKLSLCPFLGQLNATELHNEGVFCAGGTLYNDLP